MMIFVLKGDIIVTAASFPSAPRGDGETLSSPSRLFCCTHDRFMLKAVSDLVRDSQRTSQKVFSVVSQEP